MKPKRAGRRIWIEAGLVIIVVVLTIQARYGFEFTKSALTNIELRSLDTRFKIRGSRSPREIQSLASRLAIVAMDSNATHKFGHPVPRSVHARLVRQLKKAGARAVIFDVLFIDRGRPLDDRDFAAACAEAGNVFLPMDNDAVEATSPDVLEKVRKKLSYPVNVPRTAHAVRLDPPVAPLFNVMAGGGHVVTQGDDTGKFRSAVALLEAGAVYPHVALDAVARGVWGVKPGPQQVQLDANYLKIGTHRIGPLTQRGLERSVYNQPEPERSGTAWMMPLNFIGYRKDLRQLYVPYLVALEDEKQARERLKGRVVIIGETATGTPDLRPGPFDTSEITLGVETNATFIANLLEDNFLQPASFVWALLATLALGVLSSLLVLALRPWLAAVGTAAVALGYVVIATTVFGTHNLILEMTAPLLATVVSFVLLTSYRMVFVDREVQQYALQLHEAEIQLGRVTDERLVHDLISNPEMRRALQIGTRREVTVLFSDIRGFTAWSENQTPEEVKTRLDEYLAVMCEIAMEDYEGYLDKFIGDAVMVQWNAMSEQPDHAERAVRTALSMQRALTMLNDGWRRQKQQEFRIGIGIATGRVVFGSFGDPERKLMVTALGDTVNFASRLETLTKEIGCQIVISDATYQAIKGKFEVRTLGPMPIRGKAEIVQIYEVVGAKAEVTAQDDSRAETAASVPV